VTAQLGRVISVPSSKSNHARSAGVQSRSFRGSLRPISSVELRKAHHAERHSIPVINFNLLVDAGYAADQFAVPRAARLAMAMLDKGTKTRNRCQQSRSSLERRACSRSQYLLHCYALGQIARLVDIATAANGDVIGKKLQRNNFKDGQQEIVRRWDFDVIIGRFDRFLVKRRDE
jgi:hypothetical protein